MGRSDRDGTAWREHTLGLRRERLMWTMVHLVCEQGGFAQTSLTTLCARAKISRTAFYEVFDSRESCFLAALDEGYRRVIGVTLAALAEADDWLDCARIALARVLWLFDSEPQLARICLVEALAAGPWALEHRQAHVGGFLRTVIEHSGSLAPPEPHPFANTGIVASVVAIVEGHLRTRNPQPLIGLLGPLMGIVAAPYLDGEIVSVEVRRAEALAAELLEHFEAERTPPNPVVDVPAVLRDPRAWRMRLSLAYMVGHPGASNRQVARAIGVESHTQMSALLSRLKRLGLIYKLASGPGRPNAWWLTNKGNDVACALHDQRRCSAQTEVTSQVPLKTVM